jgi:aminoglycoside phosphotransferase (APT) family kinase protein
VIVSDVESTQDGTRPMEGPHGFDPARLASYLRERLGSRAGVCVQQFSGGQSNPTFLVTAADGTRFVLRRKPSGVLLPSAHAIEREFRVMKALESTGVPVPRMYDLCEDAAVIGSPFYLMEFVEGRILWDPSIPSVETKERTDLYRELNRVIATIHSIDPVEAGLGDFGRAGNYIARQIDRWTRQYRASETERIDAVERLIEWLPDHLPKVSETRLVHGDYRIDNIIFHPREPRVLAVLDWELATLGDPLADFAYHCMRWRMAPPGGLAGLSLDPLGLPSEQAYLEEYLARGTRRAREVTANEWNFYIVFSMFRLVGIAQGVLKRAFQGNASSLQAMEAGRRVRPLAERAWSQAQHIIEREN